MISYKKIKEIILDPQLFYHKLRLKLFACNPKLMSDRAYITSRYYIEFRKKLDLRNPCSFNEKLQWLKLYNRNPKYVEMVDKYTAKKYVASIIGEEYVIPTYGIWDSFDEIDFDSLPEQFVLKTTHDSGSVVICKDKAKFDKERARNILLKSLSHDYYLDGREWPYKDVPRRIIAEKYMEDETGELRDFKFFCFDGKVKAMFIATDRYSGRDELKFDFFNEKFDNLPFKQGHPISTELPPKPVNFDLMVKLAAELSQEEPHIRVDFYECGGKVYFGELTFYHFSGFTPFEPQQWDYTFGSWLSLPEKKF